MPGSKSSSTTPEPPLHVAVLAGGVGSRFWPVSTPERPKQLLPLAGERPLIVDTVDRARMLAPAGRIHVVTGAGLVDPIRRVVPDLDADAFLVEPRARGTGPALVWAAWTIARRQPEAVLVSLHADHAVSPDDAFVSTLDEAAALAARHRRLMTVAVTPDRAEVGYGYIEPGASLEAAPGRGAFEVASFHEKPDRATAEAYVEDGYLWNSGIFAWRCDVFLDEVRRRAPEMEGALERLDAGDVDGFFQQSPHMSVDEAVLERSERVAAVEATFRWDDVGSWEALARARPPDDDGNVSVGPAHVVDGARNVVYADDRPVVLWGVDDLVAVRTAGMTLVTRRELAPRLKELLERLPDDLVSPEI